MPLDGPNLTMFGQVAELLKDAGYDVKPEVYVLLRARWLIENTGWCRGHCARTWWGWPVPDPTSPKAARFCALGAIRRAAYDLGYFDPRFDSGVVIAVLNRFARSYPLTTVPSWNDAYGRTKDQVLAGFDQVLATW